jgi:hypothetical protein
VLLPSLSKAKASARSIACAANLHQVHLAAMTYDSDYNSRVVPE